MVELEDSRFALAGAVPLFRCASIGGVEINLSPPSLDADTVAGVAGTSAQVGVKIMQLIS